MYCARCTKREERGERREERGERRIGRNEENQTQKNGRRKE